jgi:hypothetical protein
MFGRRVHRGDEAEGCPSTRGKNARRLRNAIRGGRSTRGRLDIADRVRRGEYKLFSQLYDLLKNVHALKHTCPHAGIGCPYKGPLNGTEHLGSCPYESLKGFFAMNTARMSLLTEQNMLLRHRVDTLESTVFTLRREMNAAKKALGPWLRSGVSSELPTGASGGPRESGGDDELAGYFPSEEVETEAPGVVECERGDVWGNCCTS